MVKYTVLILVCVALAVLSVPAQKPSGGKIENLANGKEVTFEAADGVKVFADLHLSPKGKEAPVILLFHQGGADVRGEYERILPSLLAGGYNVIAADLRVGGTVFEGTNRTATALAVQQTDYCAAYPDLVATLEFAEKEGFKGKKIAWGSSYSAALVFRLAAENPGKLAGVLAFSPASGGPMEECRPQLYSENVKVPLLALRPASEMQRDVSKAQFEDFRKQGHQTYVSENGVHGSSMLDAQRVEGDVSEHWKTVKAFLKRVLEQ
ncbi:MAG: hypothetical protein DWQ47_09415 [Acidobacteria bacterium]|nr:MAG: hypothetical protein DWQ32_17515 [Acidobacteriota bacterium]REJ98881.1 MAG: hypothetical protein DWQ38_12460 [Acidobacteriota bacterium]REK16399.1 MAG: hypothetical protein DWQ43_05225 [Acidobacteriota bacterium]REK44080.1 MAG: hypothetical protein DWQ47_09415 [Acidobacteriota bacterium]